MSLLQTRRLVLSLALSLLWPVMVFAQTPVTPAKATPPQMQIKVNFVTASTVDVDNLGIKFDHVPFPLPAAKTPPEGTFLQCSTGSLVSQIYQTIVRTRGDVVHTPLITTADSVPATFQVTTLVPYHINWSVASPFGETALEKAQHTKLLLLQVGLTVTPRVNSDGSVTLDLAPQVGVINATTTGPRAAILRTVQNGETLLLAGLPTSRLKPINDQELLIFVTPTIVGTGAQKADVRQPDLSPAPFQDTSPASKKTVSLDVANADLRAVVAMLERQVGIKTAVLGDDQPYKPVYVHLDGVSLSKALRTVAWSAGAKVTKNEDGVYVFSPPAGSDQTPIPIPVAPPDGGLSITVNGSSVTVTP